MKYRVYNTEAEARTAQNEIYAQFLRDRAARNDGSLHDWSTSPVQPILIADLSESELRGDRFPLYGQRASDLLFITEYGHTTAWATPQQIADGRWVFQSPNETGVDPGVDWWPATGSPA